LRGELAVPHDEDIGPHLVMCSIVGAKTEWDAPLFRSLAFQKHVGREGIQL
jgi:hypothetical protein